MSNNGSRITNPPVSRFQAYIIRPGRVEMWDSGFAIEPWVVECQPGQEVAVLLDLLAKSAAIVEETDRELMERAWHGG